MKQLIAAIVREAKYYWQRITCKHQYRLQAKMIGVRLGKETIVTRWYKCVHCYKEVMLPMDTSCDWEEQVWKNRL